MQRLIFSYGLYATIIIVVFGIFNLSVVKSMGFEAQEIVGYLGIFISMIFVFIGIKQYRDTLNHGKLSFKEGLKIGFLIVLIPSVAFGTLDLVYTELINPGWQQEYYNHYLEQYKSLPAAEYEKIKTQLKAQQEMFSSPLIQFVIMSLTVMIIGLIASVISAFSLKRP